MFRIYYNGNAHIVTDCVPKQDLKNPELWYLQCTDVQGNKYKINALCFKSDILKAMRELVRVGYIIL